MGVTRITLVTEVTIPVTCGLRVPIFGTLSDASLSAQKNQSVARTVSGILEELHIVPHSCAFGPANLL